MMIVAGIGFRKAAPLASLHEVVARLSPAPQALATLREKADQPQVRDLAAALGLPLLAVDVAGTDTPTESAAVRSRFGTGSLAEAAALVAAGRGARLIAARIVSQDGMATAALAEGEGL